MNGILKFVMKHEEKEREIKSPAANERFGVIAAVARRNGSANLKVCTPQEVQWKPPLRQAATTLSASGGQRAVGQRVRRSERLDKEVEINRFINI